MKANKHTRKKYTKRILLSLLIFVIIAIVLNFVYSETTQKQKEIEEREKALIEATQTKKEIEIWEEDIITEETIPTYEETNEEIET